MTISGCDVSSFQGAPGQWAGAAGAFDFAGVKVTELQPSGTRYVNPDAAADWAALKAAGKGRIAYLFGHPATSITETVSFFAAQMATLGVDDGDVICLDHEESDGVPAAKVASWGCHVLAALKAKYDREILLYTFLDYASEGYCAGMGSYPLWVADPDSPAGKPEVPAPWKTWALHQYDISGPLDRDVAHYASLAAMQAALGRKTTPPPAPSGDDPMKFISDVTLAGSQEIPATGQPVALKWAPKSASPSLLAAGDVNVKIVSDSVSLSSVSLDFAEAGAAAISLVRTGTVPTLSRQHDGEGGWDNFTIPFYASEGAGYSVTVTNYGAVPLTVSAGEWQIVS